MAQHGHSEKTLGERNKEHFEKFAEDAFHMPWVMKLSNQIATELQRSFDWIGIVHPKGEEGSNDMKMLDYACGNGLASRALGLHFTTVRGIDISSAMAKAYNDRARQEGFSAESRYAIQADLLSMEASTSLELSHPDFSEFDLIVMCMALHHVESHTGMIQHLANRLKVGGVLVIVDWVSPEESGCPRAEKAEELSNHTITKLGFMESEVKSAYEAAGLKGWAWKWAPQRSRLPEEIGSEQQFFMARGQKTSDDLYRRAVSKIHA